MRSSPMRILVTGACGFVGSNLLHRIREAHPSTTLLGVDNFCRPGSERNRSALRALGVHVIHGDVRCASDFDALANVDWVIDAAANPSVLAGVDGRTSSRQLVEHNLGGTVNMLEFCRNCGAGFILLSTSRVYSIPLLCNVPLKSEGQRFVVDESKPLPAGLSPRGVNEAFSAAPPLSLYGTTKKMSEDLALEYHHTFKLPVWINRCGVMAGAGQFGRADQGIVAYWLHSWRERRPLKYLGFQGTGHQVRDVLHPLDLADLLIKQMQSPDAEAPRLANVSGGAASAFSLADLSAFAEQRFGHSHPVERSGSERPFDIPWLVLDDAKARAAWQWQPGITRDALFEEVAAFAEREPEWMSVSAV
jgi:CDP-paratose 2-epimerase